MKLVKMSLVAAMLCGASAFAIENVKVEGAGNLFYSTTESDATNAPDLFSKDASAGQASLKLGATADLTEGVSGGATLYAISTLGLENNLVDKVWEMGTDSEYWFGEAWVSATKGNTTAKVGRMELDTPLVFSETWSIAPNTFETVVLVNTDVPDTTLVGAYVGKHNAGGTTAGVGAILNEIDAVSDTAYGKFYKGAYAAGAVTTAIPMTTAQVWYYDLVSTAKAFWVQADVEVEGIMAGAQFASVDLDATGTKSTDAMAVMLGYALKDVVTLKAAYSTVSDDGSFNVANTSTNFESRLYTEMWWNFSNVSAAGADSFSVTAEGSVANIDLFAGFYNASIKHKGGTEYDLQEVTVTASKSYGPLDTTVAVILDDKDDIIDANDVKNTTAQVYLTYNF